MSKTISILNHVLGPVMRGPSSSHTAGGYHLGCMARSLLGAAPRRAALAFDPHGSYAQTYSAQGADRAFAMGLMGRPLEEESFFTALDDARQIGIDIGFEIRPLHEPEHPNQVEIELIDATGATLGLVGRSIGGGEVEITRLNDWPVLFRGAAYEVLVETKEAAADEIAAALGSDGALLGEPERLRQGDALAVVARRAKSLPAELRDELAKCSPDARVFESKPVYYVQPGEPLFFGSAEMVALAQKNDWSLGRLALEYETRLLEQSPEAVSEEMLRRYDVMHQSVLDGLDRQFTGMQLLGASAGNVFAAEADGRLSGRSFHTRAAARSMAVMHVDGAMGVVCAAPTGGSAGVIPGALVTLAEERGLGREQIAQVLLAAGAIGVVIAQRATFAAEVAGCQVEIGAAGAMAAAAVVEAVGGSARQASDAAAISLQNTMGLVCDLVQGTVEIPCHTRNAVAAANAFLCADLVLGSYENPIPLDETIDAVYAVGRSMPRELLCTSEGGLAVTPSAMALSRRAGRCGDCGGCGPTPRS